MLREAQLSSSVVHSRVLLSS